VQRHLLPCPPSLFLSPFFPELPWTDSTSFDVIVIGGGPRAIRARFAPPERAQGRLASTSGRYYEAAMPSAAPASTRAASRRRRCWNRPSCIIVRMPSLVHTASRSADSASTSHDAEGARRRSSRLRRRASWRCSVGRRQGPAGSRQAARRQPGEYTALDGSARSDRKHVVLATGSVPMELKSYRSTARRSSIPGALWSSTRCRASRRHRCRA